MRVFLVFAAAVVAAGCFVLAPGAPQLTQVADVDASQLTAGDSIPPNTCAFDEGGTGSMWCSPSCHSGVEMSAADDVHKGGDESDPCVAEGGCGSQPRDVQDCDT